MEYDVIFEGAVVVDGTGRFPYRADVGVKKGKIEDIGLLKDAQSKRRIDGCGKILSPGFIDVHAHTDLSIHQPNHHEILEPLLRQGITTTVGGNCGWSLAPLDSPYAENIMDFLEGLIGSEAKELIDWKSFAGFMDTIEKRGTVLNLGVLAPHGFIRIGQMGMSKRLAKPDELKNMKTELQKCLDAGALGMSTGLQYFPGSQADTDELVEMAKLLPDADAVFTSHLRSYSNTLDQAIDEVKTVCRQTGVPTQISHLFWVPHVTPIVDSAVRAFVRLGSKINEHVTLPVPLDSAVAQKLNKLGKEIEEGLPMGIDGMPTSAGFTSPLFFLPPWVLEDNVQKIMQRISDPATRKKIRHDIEHGQSVWPHRAENTWSMNFFKVMGWGCAFIMSVVSEKNKHLEGMNLLEVAKLAKKHPLDALLDLLIEENGHVLVFETVTKPGDDFIERSLFATIKDPNVSIVTDTILLGYGRPAHLFYDCFPKFISRYIRDYGFLTIQEGIRKCTSLPASQLGIKKRGEIKEGYYADLVLFDLDKINTNSTFEKPDVFPNGIDYVMVNGQIVVDPSGYHPEPRSGKLIRRQNQ